MLMSLDISGLLKQIEEAKKLIDAVPKTMTNIAKLGAQYERQHHAYQNRTGNLQRSTKGLSVRSSRTNTTVQLEAGAPYASYVRARGLMAIDDAAKRTEAAIQDYLSDLPQRITRGF